MSFERAGDILRDAYRNGYGVPAFNVFNFETIKLAIQAAEEIQKPIIIEFYPGWKDFISFDVIAGVTKTWASKVKIPIGLHLDHCGDFEQIMQAMQSGFLSVMYDGSRLPFEENVQNTKEVVRAAKALNIDVEAELGNIGNASNVDDFADQSKFTSPKDALEFFNETGVSSLAIAVGNAHGNYVQLPNIDLDRIQTISNSLKIPLVLHGGSGIPDDQVRKAVKCGIAKMNVATEYHNAYYKAVEAYVKGDNRKDMYACANATQKDILRFLNNKINLLNNH